MNGPKLPFLQIDVFTSVPFKGNPVAVVNCMDVKEDQISYEKLQSIANWTNLSETTFLFKPTDGKSDYKVRIMTPASELPFAGHPTIGTARAYLKFTGRTGVKHLLQQCKLGIVELSIADSGKISFRAPAVSIEEIGQAVIDDYKQCLSIDYIAAPKLLHVGPKWAVYLASSAEACYNANPNFTQMANVCELHGHTGIILAGESVSEKNHYEMRAFAPHEGVNEDPVCGSGSIALIGYLHDLYKVEETTDYTITQGGRVRRDGFIASRVEINEDGKLGFISGGDSVIIIEGSITL